MGLSVFMHHYPEGFKLPKNEDDEPAGGNLIELPSAIYPNHYFKIGYLRSSYNEGGFNSVVGSRVDHSLDSIFAVGNSDYYVQPHWENSLRRAEIALSEFKAASEALPVRALFEKGDGTVESERNALAIYAAEKARERSPLFDSYSSARGSFNFGTEPQRVRAFIPGRHFGERGVWVITEASDQWYIEALEIVVEMIKWVMEKPDPQNYVLHWSG